MRISNNAGALGQGPLHGIRILEFTGLGPTPFAAMMLADMGADVLRITRHDADDGADDPLHRGRPALPLDLKQAADVAQARALADRADVVLEGYRPGVMERLELGPDVLCARNERLVYARMTGWGQTGPLAHKAGHDINYIALTGGLHMVGPADRPPPPPLNLVGDFGGGALFAVTGILAALIERQASGRGQTIDIAMVDGATELLTQIHGWRASGMWRPEREANMLDGGAYFYRCYETADGGHMAVGAIEPQFHAALIAGLDLDPADFADQRDPAHWTERSDRLAARFRMLPRDAWEARFSGLDACVTPVLTLDEAKQHPANRDRAVYQPDNALPAPAPRFGRTPAMAARPVEHADARAHRWIGGDAQTD